MTTVFSTVEAAIADDLIERFPNEFDFDAMLRRVCEDAGVDVNVAAATDPGKMEVPLPRYKLKGLWLSMEKAYKHLVTTVALYGTWHSDAITTTDVNSKSIPDLFEDSITFGGEESNNKRRRIPVRKILANSENKRVRRPRKSAIQNRKLDYSSGKRTDSSDKNADKVKSGEGSKERDLISKPETSGIFPHDEIENHITDNDFDNENIDCKENESSKVVADNKSKEIEGDVSQEKKDGVEKPAVRRRGRPKVYNDDDIAEFPCTQCSFVAKKRTKLRTHMLRMHLSAPSTCDLCNKVFPNKRYMMRHRASHGGPQHCCDICGKMYKIRKAMLDHRKTHDANYQRPSFQCSSCPKSFCNQYILDCHVKDVHQGLKKSYLCSVCGKSFTTKHSLTEHSNAHKGVKPHACEICGKTFSYESALRDHKFSHMESKNFWCKHCQKGFSQRSGLKMHMRTHKLNKTFMCSECGRGFTQKQALQRHERVHKGEKPFICKYCGRFFTDASIVRRHLILVHKIHKSASTWREDIICTVVANTDHHVQKVGEEENLKLKMIEKQKKDIQQLLSEKSKPQNLKGPSRAFNRTYPRRVAALDDEGNVIAPPEITTSSTPAKLNLNNKCDQATLSFQVKPFPTQSPTGTSIILTPDTTGSLDATHVLNPRYLDSQQWDAITSQLSKEAGTHIEHIILDDTGQHDLNKNLDQVQGIHKIIKYETMHNTQLDPSARVSTLNPCEYNTIPSPRSSPVSFSTLSTSQSRALEGHFEPLTHAAGQYYDNRSGIQSNAQWSSMYYYTQLATLGINSEYSYINANAASSSHLLSPYVTHSSSDGQADTTSSVIPNKDMPESEAADHRNLSSNLEVVNSTAVSQSLILPTQSSLLSTRQLNEIKMNSVSGDETIQSAEIIIQQNISNLSDDKSVHDISDIPVQNDHELKEK